MRTAPTVDRAPTVIATGFGLVWRGFTFLLLWGLFLAFVGLLLKFWWVALTIVVLFLVFYLPWAVKRSMERHNARVVRDEAHLQKYGHDPKPW